MSLSLLLLVQHLVFIHRGEDWPNGFGLGTTTLSQVDLQAQETVNIQTSPAGPCLPDAQTNYQLFAFCIVGRSSWAFPSFHAIIEHETT